ncbi:MAG TPA: VOC family protein [Candidatus Binataceae bacterium]
MEERSEILSMAPSEKTRMRFDHVSIAVKSIDRAMDFFARYFPIQLRNDKRSEEQVVGSFMWQDFYLGGFCVELIEDPPSRPGFVGKFIERHGEGMHHLSIEVDHLEPLLARMKQGGVRVVDEQAFDHGSRTAFISPRSAFGALIQFWQVPDFDAPHHTRPASDGRANFDHVSLAVRDIGAAYDFFARYFDGKTTHDPHLSNSESNFVLGHMEVAGFKIEFIQSPAHKVENDFVGKFIERHGEGMHHLSMDLKDFDGTLAKLKAGGIRIVDEKLNWRGERQFFISPRSAFGVLIQVWDGM